MNRQIFIGIWLLCMFSLIFMLVSNGRYGGDGVENYLTAESIVLDKDFYIYDRPFEVKEMRYEIRGRETSSGKRVSAYGLGMAILLVPFYLVGHAISYILPAIPHGYITQFVCSFTNCAMLSLLAVVLFYLLRNLGFSPKVSLYAVTIYSVCTMNIVYARSGFSEPTIALLVTLAALFMLIYSKRYRILPLSVAAISIGYAVFIKKNSLILLPAFIFYLLYLLLLRFKKERRVGRIFIDIFIFALPLALSFFAVLLQNRLLYGGYLHTEFGSISNAVAKVRSDGYPIKGLYYYMISSGKGFLIYNTPLILGLFAIKSAFKRNRGFFATVSLLVLSNLLFYSLIFVRGSLFSWGPRYLFPSLPLYCLFLTEFLDKNKAVKAARRTVLFFALTGFIVQFPALIINFSQYLFFVRDRLKLDEYLMVFMPDLSPIKGSWSLFFSMLNRFFTGASLEFLYNPDITLIKPVSVTLGPYDNIDIWWANVINLFPQMAPLVAAAVIFMLTCLALSILKVKRYIYDYEA